MITDAPKASGGELKLAVSLEPTARRAPFQIPPAEARRRLARLTPRQREVAELIAHGLLGHEIAAQLGIAEATLFAHRNSINLTLGTHGPRDVAALMRAAKQGESDAAVAAEPPAQEPTAPEKLARLTPREREVFDLIAKGHTPRSAARLLGVSHKTVEAHATSARLKLGQRIVDFAAAQEGALS